MKMIAHAVHTKMNILLNNQILISSK